MYIYAYASHELLCHMLLLVMICVIAAATKCMGFVTHAKCPPGGLVLRSDLHYLCNTSRKSGKESEMILMRTKSRVLPHVQGLVARQA